MDVSLLIFADNRWEFSGKLAGDLRTTDVVHSNATSIRSWEKFTLVDVIHSDATQLLEWEKFTLISLGGGVYAIQTSNGNYVTAVGGGGRTTDVIHTDATRVGTWEKFRLVCGLR